jgi:hypothetical protein
LGNLTQILLAADLKIGVFTQSLMAEELDEKLIYARL